MIEFDVVFPFVIRDVSFGTLSAPTICCLLKDGRVASHFVERQLVEWFDNLVFEDGKGYDYRCKETDELYDAKCFTKGGLNFSPSVMIGAGRKVDEEKLHKHAGSINYILCDIYEFPKLNVLFKRGKDLILDYPTGKIPFKKRNEIFAPVTQLDRVSDF